jgi:cytochrome c
VRPSRAGAALAIILHAGLACAGGDPERGAVVFQKCYACHSVVPGETGLPGPNLAGVVGRRIASVPGFDYSKALLERRGEVWTEPALDAFIRAPEDLVPGTEMSFMGLPDAGERADVIAYLEQTR